LSKVAAVTLIHIPEDGFGIHARLNTGDVEEYFLKEKEVREDNHIPANDPILFLEIQVR
jgi:hypothetical protein